MAQYNRFLIASLLAFISFEPTYFIACAHKQKDPMEAYFESVAADLAQAEQEEQAAESCVTQQSKTLVSQSSALARIDAIEARIRANLEFLRQFASRYTASCAVPQAYSETASSRDTLHQPRCKEEEIKILKAALTKISLIHNKFSDMQLAAETYVNVLAQPGVTIQEKLAAHNQYLRLYTDVFDYGIGMLPERLDPLAEGYNGICARILDICSNPSNFCIEQYHSEIKELWLIVKTQIWPTLKEEANRLQASSSTQAATSLPFQ